MVCFCPSAFTTGAIALVAVSYVGCDVYAVVIILMCAVGCAGLGWSSFLVNHLDIAPNFADILLGITNTTATLPGIMAPYVVGVLIAGQEVREKSSVSSNCTNFNLLLIL